MNRRIMWVWVCVIVATLVVATPLAAAPLDRGPGASYDRVAADGSGWFGRLLDWAVGQVASASKDDPPEPPAGDDTGATVDPDG